MTPTEVWVTVAVVLSLLILFGVVAWQNRVEKRIESAARVQERLEALNRGHK